MGTLASEGMSVARDARGAGREAAGRACAGLAGRRADFCFVFGTSGYDPRELLAGVREVTDARCGGCSGEGVIAGDLTSERPRAAVVLAVSSSALRFEAHLVAGYDVDSGRAGAALAGMVRAGGEAAAVLVFPDGLSGDCARFLDALHEGLGPACPVVAGGAAGDAMELQRTWQFRDGEAMTGGVGAVVIRGPARVEVAVGHGCEALGRRLEVTRAEGPWLYEIDGEPALRVFERYLAGGADDLTAEGIAHLGVGEFSEAEPERLTVIHTPHRFDRENGALGFPGGGLRLGPVRVARRDADRVRESALRCGEDLRARCGGRAPAFVLQFDCAGRGHTLFGDAAGEAIVRPARVAVGAEVPWAGFHAYGEVAPAGGRARYHNYTVALCAVIDEGG